MNTTRVDKLLCTIDNIFVIKENVNLYSNRQRIKIYFLSEKDISYIYMTKSISYKIIVYIVNSDIFYDIFTDVDDVKYVINFDYPSSSEDYIHRIGRTGRRRQTGTAYAFFTSHNMKHAGDLIEVLREAGQNVNPRLSEMAEMAKAGNFSGRGMFL